MSKTLHMKQGHSKVLAKNSTTPYFSVNCPCDQPIITGHWFADYIQYNMDSQIQLQAASWPTYDNILQTDDLTTMSSVNSDWKPSAVQNPQYQFYDADIPNDISQGSDAVYYRTVELTQTNNSFLLPIKLFKENRWWNNYDSHSIVSGNSASGIYDCYNLSTAMGTLELSKNQSSGFISSIIINNWDNSYRSADFITVSGLSEFAISVNDNDSSIPTISAAYPDENKLDYAPLSEKCEAAVQYYLSRLYKGDQEGYIFNFNQPQVYETGLGTQIINHFMLAGADNVPVTGKTYYFVRPGDYWRSIRKIGNQYFGYDTYDQKTIVEYSPTAVQSANLQWDDWRSQINKVTTGLIAQVLQGRWTTDYNLLSTADGIIRDPEYDGRPLLTYQDSQQGQTWSNYTQNIDGQDWYFIKIDNQSGQFFNTSPSQYETIDGINYYWQQFLFFPKEYDSATSTCLLNVYKFGQDQTNDIYCSGFATSTAILTTRVQDYQDYQNGWMDDPQPQVEWDTELSCFYYLSGGGNNSHPAYMNYYFTLTEGYDGNHNPIISTYYVYKAPAWGVIQWSHLAITFGDYIVTGNTYDTLQCWTVDNWSTGGEPLDQVPISTGYYCYRGVPNTNYYLACVSGQDYWSVLSSVWDDELYQYVDYYVPLTGGCISNPQKSVAADNPDRPPYWYFSDGEFASGAQSRNHDYYTDIESCRFISLVENPSETDDRSIGVIVPLYYDTQYGQLINTYYNIGIKDWLNVSGKIMYEQWPKAVEMIHNHVYDSNKDFVCPFVKYVETRRTYYSNDNPLISNFLNNSHLNTTNTTVESLPNDHYPYQFLAYWGGNQPDSDGTNYYYDLVTQQFNKMSVAEIEDSSFIPTGTIDYSISAALPYMDSLQCQILTGVWIRKIEDDEDICGIRIHGYFNQTLYFDTEYKFGFDLTNINDLDAVLSNDTSICYTKVGNNYIPVHVNDYWNDIKGTLASNKHVSDMNINKFRNMCHIRVLRANYSINVQP